MLDGQNLYEQHRDDLEGWGVPQSLQWEDLTPEQRANWEDMAAELVEKRLSDERTPA